MKKEILKPGLPKAQQPHTAAEIEEEARKRLSIINKEFAEGLAFITQFPKSVTFFGSSMLPESNPEYEHAKQLAAKLSELGYTIVTGGGPGIMEAANRGAYEAGKSSVGLNIELPHEQKRNDFLTDYYDFHYFFSRKVTLTFGAEAYVFFPGGYGTPNEFFEIVMLIQTRRLTKAPIFLVGSKFWKPLDDFMREVILKKWGTVEEDDLLLYEITDNDEEIVSHIKKAPIIATPL